MGTLQGSFADPRIPDAFAQQEAKVGADEKALEIMEEELANWVAFKRTRNGQIIANLVDPFIENLTRMHESSTVQMRTRFPQLAPDEIRELRAELRGELRCWYRIKYRQQELERLLSEIEKTKEDRQARQKRKGVLPKEAEEYA